jgi:F0F1-type ATP synthase gamma subunit
LVNKVKKYLKNIAKTHSLTETKQIVKKLVEHPDLTEIEKWLIYYTYGENRMVVNTCRKLGLSDAQYYIAQNLALTKLYYILHI